MTDTFQNWVERIVGGRESKPLIESELIQAPAGQPYGIMEFVQTDRKHYRAEIGEKNGDYIYHFFPKFTNEYYEKFEDRMGDAFIRVFKMKDRIESTYTEELNSFAVRARGFANNPMSDKAALDVFDVLDHMLG